MIILIQQNPSIMKESYGEMAGLLRLSLNNLRLDRSYFLKT